MRQHRAEPEPTEIAAPWVPALAPLGRDDNKCKIARTGLALKAKRAASKLREPARVRQLWEEHMADEKIPRRDFLKGAGAGTAAAAAMATGLAPAEAAPAPAPAQQPEPDVWLTLTPSEV